MYVGRRPGGDGGDRSQGGERTNNSTVVPGGDNNNNNKVTRRWNQPMSLAELRALRAEAAESRLPPELSRNKKSSSTGGKLTPLGSILLLARKVHNPSSLYLVIRECVEQIYVDPSAG